MANLYGHGADGRPAEGCALERLFAAQLLAGSAADPALCGATAPVPLGRAWRCGPVPGIAIRLVTASGGTHVRRPALTLAPFDAAT